MAKITFVNPSNAYRETYDTVRSPLWCLLFGCFYWLARGNIAQALLGFIAAVCSFGISWLFYPLFANRINIRNYQRKGWILADAALVPVKEMQRIKLADPKPARFRCPRMDDYRSRRWWTPLHEWYWRNWKWTTILTIILVIINCLVWPDMIKELTK